MAATCTRRKPLGYLAESALRDGANAASAGEMDRPLWQILFNIALIGFVARHAAYGLALHSDRAPPALWGVYVALITICAFAAIAILFSRRWVFGGVIATLAAFAVATFVEIGIGSLAPPVWLIGQLVMGVAFGAVILWWARASNAGDTAS